MLEIIINSPSVPGASALIHHQKGSNTATVNICGDIAELDASTPEEAFSAGLKRFRDYAAWKQHGGDKQRRMAI